MTPQHVDHMTSHPCMTQSHDSTTHRSHDLGMTQLQLHKDHMTPLHSPASPLFVHFQLHPRVSELGSGPDRTPGNQPKVSAQVGDILGQLGGRQLHGEHLVQVPECIGQRLNITPNRSKVTPHRSKVTRSLYVPGSLEEENCVFSLVGHRGNLVHVEVRDTGGTGVAMPPTRCATQLQEEWS